MDSRSQNLRVGGGLLPTKSPQRSNAPARPQAAQMNRAARFEDEKARIIESCFSKKDDKDILLDTYITHIRITEDSQYPTTPHPPDSPSANKERVIIVAVRNTGRVRIHKARENVSGSYSIGKTWNLDDLTTIQSWADYVPQTPEEEKFKSWAGEVGFTVTIIKPYYWQANTAKEKEFFIHSVVKIYRKYTQGNIPELVGFLPRDVEQMAGQSSRATSGISPGKAPQIPPFSPGRPHGFPQSGSSPPIASYQGPLEPPPRNRPPISNPNSLKSGSFFEQRAPASQSPTPPPSNMLSASDAGREGGFNRMPSREVIGNGRSVSQTTSSNLALTRQRTPDSFASIGDRRSPSSTRDGSRDGLITNAGNSGVPARSNGPSLDSVRSTPVNGHSSPDNAGNGSQGSLQEQALPERRRPPMMNQQSNDLQAGIRAGSVSSRRPGAGVVGSTTSSSTDSLTKGKERMPGGFIPSPAPSQDMEQEGLLPPPLATKSRVRTASPAPTSAPATWQQAEAQAQDQKKADSPDVSPVVSTPETEEKQLEGAEARPGLGRMFGAKNRSAKDILKTAATAYGSFVPRAGGAAARMKAAMSDEKEEGVSAVFKAPGLSRQRTDDSVKVDTPREESSIQATPISAKAVDVPNLTPEPVPQVTVSSPTSQQKDTAHPPPVVDALLDSAAENENFTASIKAKQAEESGHRRKIRRSAQQMRYLAQLGIDGLALENKGLDFETTLHDIGWGSNAFLSRSVDNLETDIRREISRVEAESWLGHLEQKDDRVEIVEKLLDRTIAEVDELDGLLALYSVELSSLNDDIAFIEAQSQGLQVQTANQKLLQSELQNLVRTIRLDEHDLAPLRGQMPSVRNPRGLVVIEHALLLLYKAMVTIDPTIRQTAVSAHGQGLMVNSELSNMVALQQKSDQYLSDCSMFLKRFGLHMDMTFGAAMMLAKDLIDQQKGINNAKLSMEAHDRARSELWQYSPLMLFAKEIDRTSWDDLIKQYQRRAGPVYMEEFRGQVQFWKKLARKPTGDEQELLFTYNPKEEESLTGTARRITVKRSQTLARGLRSASNDKDKSRGGDIAGSVYPSEVFSGALEEMTPLITVEQNFIVEFFHATSLTKIDFAEAVAAAPPEKRVGGTIYTRRAFEPDREMAQRIAIAMEEIFAVFPAELAALIEWATKTDPLQGVGIMSALHIAQAQCEDTNQEFLVKSVNVQAQRLSGLWTKFIDEQIRAIEDTKVKIKKRKGVIAFIKTFPNFSAAIEYQIPSAPEEPATGSEVRKMVDQAYARINKAMFESLRVIAKQSPSISTGAASGAASIASSREDPEDKEALNYHVLLIENMNHYIEEVDERGDTVLQEGKRIATEEYEDHLGMYVEAVVRRPLGKIIDFTDTLHLLHASLPATTPPTALSSRPQTSTQNFRKLLATHDSRELRRGVDALRKRVEKHFGDGDDPSLSKELIGKVLGRCEEKFRSVLGEFDKVGRDVYELDGVQVGGDELARWFRGGR